MFSTCAINSLFLKKKKFTFLWTRQILFFCFIIIIILDRKHETKNGWPWTADVFKFVSITGAAEPLLRGLMCSFVKTGRRLVNFNFWFQKLSNTAQMRNQFSQLPWLCGETNSCHWWTACHMTKSGISSVGLCCHHLNYRLPLVIYSITCHSQTQLIFNSWKHAQE